MSPERAKAMSDGRTRFWTGRPCCNDHLAERRTSNGCCVVCQRLNSRERYRRAHPDFVSARGRPLLPDPPALTEGSPPHGR